MKRDRDMLFGPKESWKFREQIETEESSSPEDSFTYFFALEVWKSKNGKMIFWTIRDTAFKMVSIDLESLFHLKKHIKHCILVKNDEIASERPKYTDNGLKKKKKIFDSCGWGKELSIVLEQLTS